MLTRADLEAREAALLAPYAALSRDAAREYPEAESGTRTAFQKDRDRVLHTTAFRRLDAKTQVFLNAPALGDHYRTRLTHTLEVQQVARSVALNLGLNETLAEGLALAHDLGHPPFGHAGERVLDELLRGHGGFDHNRQARRIVTELEDRYAEFPGLNLTLTTLDGLNKHDRAGLGSPSLEAQLVDTADALAYTAHDLDDGLRSGLLSVGALTGLTLWRRALDRAELAVGAPLGSAERRRLHRELLGLLISDLTAASDAALRAAALPSASAVRGAGRLITHSPELAAQVGELRRFLYEELYRHWRLEMQVEQAEQVLQSLYHAFERRPSLLPPRPRERLSRGAPLPRVIADHIAGMTDRYALEICAALSVPGGLGLPGGLGSGTRRG